MDEAIFRLQHNTAMIEQDAAYMRRDAEKNRRQWAVVLGLTPKRDGNMWSIVWGGFVDGVAAFAETPEKCIEAFEEEMKKTLPASEDHAK